jgi:hypothetical protein
MHERNRFGRAHTCGKFRTASGKRQQNRNFPHQQWRSPRHGPPFPAPRRARGQWRKRPPGKPRGPRATSGGRTTDSATGLPPLSARPASPPCVRDLRDACRRSMPAVETGQSFILTFCGKSGHSNRSIARYVETRKFSVPRPSNKPSLRLGILCRNKYFRSKAAGTISKTLCAQSNWFYFKRVVMTEVIFINMCQVDVPMCTRRQYKWARPFVCEV